MCTCITHTHPKSEPYKSTKWILRELQKKMGGKASIKQFIPSQVDSRHMYRYLNYSSLFTCPYKAHYFSQSAFVWTGHTCPWSYNFSSTLLCLFLSLSLAPKLLLVITMETGKAPHVAKGTRVKIWYIYFFPHKEWDSSSAVLLPSKCERGCVYVYVYSLWSH